MTGIQWTQETWNPTSGCDRLSEGCDHCYALTMAKRLKAMGQPKYQKDGDPRTSGPGFGLTMHNDAVGLPLTWRKPRKVFVNSMSDLFHGHVTDEFIARVFAVMAATPQHTYQVLTKRHGRMRSLLGNDGQTLLEATQDEETASRLYNAGWPLPNVHLGVSVENQKWASIRIPALLDVEAAVRFLSCEPLLGPVDLTAYLHGIGWCIVGGESGRGSRPMDEEWVRRIIADCRDAGVPVFVKQLGSVWAQARGADGKGGEPSYWPEDLRVREFPSSAAVPA